MSRRPRFFSSFYPQLGNATRRFSPGCVKLHLIRIIEPSMNPAVVVVWLQRECPTKIPLICVHPLFRGGCCLSFNTHAFAHVTHGNQRKSGGRDAHVIIYNKPRFVSVFSLLLPPSLPLRASDDVFSPTPFRERQATLSDRITAPLYNSPNLGGEFPQCRSSLPSREHTGVFTRIFGKSVKGCAEKYAGTAKPSVSPFFALYLSLTLTCVSRLLYNPRII